jgi:hypothetical protein
MERKAVTKSIQQTERRRESVCSMPCKNKWKFTLGNKKKALNQGYQRLCYRKRDRRGEWRCCGREREWDLRGKKEGEIEDFLKYEDR